MRNKISVLTIIILSCSVCFSSPVPKKLSALLEQSKKNLYSNQRILSVDRMDSSGIIYAASVFVTINVPFTETADALLKFGAWPKIFKSITLMQKVTDAPAYRDDQVIYYAEAKYSFIRGWGTGLLKSIDYKPNKSVFVEVVPVSDELLQRYLQKNRGLIRYHVKKMNVHGSLIRINENQCRLGIFAWAGVNKEMPVWLIEALMKVVMPSFIGDLERYVKRKIISDKKHATGDSVKK